MAPGEALARAIAIFDGSLLKLANEIGYTDAAVRRAMKTGKLSPRMANNIQLATKGAVTKEELSPDGYAVGAETLGSGWARGDKRVRRQVA